MSVAYIHCQFSRVVPGSATLQRGFWSRAGARRSQEEGTGAGLTQWISSPTLPLKNALAWSCSIGGQLFLIPRPGGDMLTREENEMLTRVGPGTHCGELIRRYWH